MPFRLALLVAGASLAAGAIAQIAPGGVYSQAPKPPFATVEAAARGRTVISDGERALATIQVQNMMSRHEFYHAAGMNLEEVDALWVDRHGGNAATATFASPAWVMNGVETVRRAYGEENQRNREKAIKAIAALDPKVKDDPGFLGAGHEWVMHPSTTAVIEVAGDGKTAKGVWYSPGLGIMASTDGGRIGAGGHLFWEKYGGDFIKENGVWKIWHLQMAYDFVPDLPREMTNPTLASYGAKADIAPAAAKREAGEEMSGAMPPGFTKPAFSYPNYSPSRPGIIYPRLPEPYYTFAETFSYCNCR